MQKKQNTKVRNMNKRDEKRKMELKERGITLIALIVTIIVLIVLSVVSINAIFGADGIINQARKTDLIVDFTVYIEEKKTYDSEKTYENSNYLQESLNAGRTTLAYNTQGENTEGNIQTVIPSMTNEMAEKFEIIKGEFLLYASDELEREVAEQLGIKISPYLIEDGVLLSANENLELQTTNGVVTLPERVTEIGAGAFSGVEGLKEVIIPGTVKVIDQDAFSYNTEIEKVTIMDGVLSIGDFAFTGCTNLKEIIIPDSVVSIGMAAFFACTNLTNVRLSNNISTLEIGVFQATVSLSEITLPENLEIIKESAFFSSGIKKIEIPARVSTMEPGAFDGCSNLYNLTINKDNQNFEIENGILYSTDNIVVSILPAGLKETITIREGVKELITQGTFVSAYNLKTLNLPSTLQEFSGSIFPQSGSVSLTNINFPNGNDNFIAKDGYVYSKDGKTLVYVVPTKSKIEINEDVETIAENALFFNCKVTELVIPDNVINLESRCFANCPNLRKIEIGSGVQYIDPQICVSNNYMIIDNRTITIDSNNKYYKMENGFILTKDGKKLVTSEKTYIPDCIVPEGVEEICDYALYRVAALTVELPSTLKKIGDYSFSQNTYIEKIEIPNSIEYIGTGAFGSCINLSEVRIDKERDSISGSPWEVPKGERAIIWLR